MKTPTNFAKTFSLIFLLFLFIGTIQNTPFAKRKSLRLIGSAICDCELQVTSGWRKEVLRNIFKRPMAPWGSGQNPCARMREGCRILCNLMGRRYLEGRSMNSESQGTKLGQRLCELHSYKNGYRPISAPGRIVSVSYRLSQCWRQNVHYMTAFKVDGNLCCKPVAPFKTYPFVRMLIWDRDCSANAVGSG